MNLKLNYYDSRPIGKKAERLKGEKEILLDYLNFLWILFGLNNAEIPFRISLTHIILI